METTKAKYRNVTTPEEIPFAPGFYLLRKEEKIMGLSGKFITPDTRYGNAYHLRIQKKTTNAR